jgi:hypothetical protein
LFNVKKLDNFLPGSYYMPGHKELVTINKPVRVFDPYTWSLDKTDV